MDENSFSKLDDDADGDLMGDESTAFPASVATPGQAVSRQAYARFCQWVDGLNTEDGKALDLPKVLLAQKPGESILDGKPAWIDDYLSLRAEGWDWRKATFIAWAASPTKKRWPANLEELATRVLGLRSERTIRKWREKNPLIDERIANLAIEPLMRHRRDVIDALIAVATDPDAKAHPDRRMFLEMTGDYKPKGQVALTNPEGGPVQVQQKENYEDMSDEQLDQLIDNLETVS